MFILKKNSLFIIFSIVFFSISFCQSGWTKLPFDYPAQHYSKKVLSDVQFVDSLYGWIMGRDGIYNTNDGGTTWELKYHPKYFWVNPLDHGIAFTRKDTCYFVVSNYLYKSYDNGHSWDSTLISDQSRYVHSAYFLNDSLGWALGRGNTEGKEYLEIYRTMNRGITWEISFKELPETFYYEKFYSVNFPSESKGFVTGMWGNIYQTSDAGTTWEKSRINDGSLFSVYFVDTNNGWAVGYDGAVLATTDGGLNWKYKNSNVESTLNDVFFTNKNHGIAVGNSGTIIYTNDGGNNWLDNSLNTFMDFYAIDFFNDDIGWIVGGKSSDSAVVYKTISGGIVSGGIKQPAVRNEFELSQNYPNPFNPTTTIKYSIPSSVILNEVKNLNVKLTVYDILGREVTTLVNKKQSVGVGPGYYEVTWDASNNPSGVYFYQLTAGSFVETKKMILLR